VVVATVPFAFLVAIKPWLLGIDSSRFNTSKAPPDRENRGRTPPPWKLSCAAPLPPGGVSRALSGHGGRVYTLASGKHQPKLRESFTRVYLHGCAKASIVVGVIPGKNTSPSFAILSYTRRKPCLTDFGLESLVVHALAMAPPRTCSAPAVFGVGFG
jgi:hypothetical protein